MIKDVAMAKTVHTTNCFNTFIRVAEDCPARTGEEPPLRAGKRDGRHAAIRR